MKIQQYLNKCRRLIVWNVCSFRCLASGRENNVYAANSQNGIWRNSLVAAIFQRFRNRANMSMPFARRPALEYRMGVMGVNEWVHANCGSQRHRKRQRKCHLAIGTHRTHLIAADTRDKTTRNRVLEYIHRMWSFYGRNKTMHSTTFVND